MMHISSGTLAEALAHINDNSILIRDPRLALVKDAEDTAFTAKFGYDDGESFDRNLDRIADLTTRRYVTEFPGPGEFVADSIDAIIEEKRPEALVLVRATRQNGVVSAAVGNVIYYTITLDWMDLDYSFEHSVGSWAAAPSPVKENALDWTFELMWDWKGAPITHGVSDAIERVANKLLSVTSRLIGTGFEPDVRPENYLFQSGVAANCALHLVCDVLEIAGNIDLLGAWGHDREYERPSTRSSFPSTHLITPFNPAATRLEIEIRIYESALFYGAQMSPLQAEVIALRARDYTKVVMSILEERIGDLVPKTDVPAWRANA